MFGVRSGFACVCCASFKPFWPLALSSQAPVAIILAALRRFRGAAHFRGSRASSSPGAPFWPSGLTLQSSGLAYGQPLTLAVRVQQTKGEAIMKKLILASVSLIAILAFPTQLIAGCNSYSDGYGNTSINCDDGTSGSLYTDPYGNTSEQ